jgi:hypothetical protein
MNEHNLISSSKAYDREGSTLGIMDDLQVAIHSYDGCSKGCPGCLVDKHFKNNMRFETIMTTEQMDLIQVRVEEYYEWIKENLNTKSTGYFGKNGYKVDHFSYTLRFGNHSELPMDQLLKITNSLRSEYRVFSTAPTEDIGRFIELKQQITGKLYLEIIYDPIVDDAEELKNMILLMRENDILGYPEVLITKRLLDGFDPKKFVEKAIGPLGNIGIQMQFGRYSPSKTRSFNVTQVVKLDDEVEWLAEVAHLIMKENMDLHPIPIGEYAVTFLDEYEEQQYIRDDGVDVSLLPDSYEFDIPKVREMTKDIFMTSIYIDHKLDLYIWSESMGQHVLDNNLGFKTFGNIKDNSISDLMNSPIMDELLNEVIRNLITDEKCSVCRYKSFCASHAIPLFRKWHKDNGKHCYGYIPVIREFQKNEEFLVNMIDGFKRLGF